MELVFTGLTWLFWSVVTVLAILGFIVAVIGTVIAYYFFQDNFGGRVRIENAESLKKIRELPRQSADIIVLHPGKPPRVGRPSRARKAG